MTTENAMATLFVRALEQGATSLVEDFKELESAMMGITNSSAPFDPAKAKEVDSILQVLLSGVSGMRSNLASATRLNS